MVQPAGYSQEPALTQRPARPTLPRLGEGSVTFRSARELGAAGRQRTPRVPSLWLGDRRVLCLGELDLHGGEVLGEVLGVAGAWDR